MVPISSRMDSRQDGSSPTMAMPLAASGCSASSSSLALAFASWTMPLAR
jgi:hypothetical protein